MLASKDSYASLFQVSSQIPHLQRPIRMRNGYRNGRFNLIEPVQFTGDLLANAGERAVEGQLLYGTPDQTLGDLWLVVVEKFPEEIDFTGRQLVHNIFDRHQVKMHLREYGATNPRYS
jgi:hypothetical protein